MSIVLCGDTIRISGEGRIEEAETLAGLLAAEPGRAVDLSQAGTLHTAIVQALLAFRPRLADPAGAGVSADPFFNLWLYPLLQPLSPRAAHSITDRASETA